jgi:hypothetical protein
MDHIRSDIEIPNEYVCPITQDIMLDPVVAIDGHSYDRESIEQWFQSHSTSPKTNEILPSTLLIPNRALRSRITEFLEENSTIRKNSNKKAINSNHFSDSDSDDHNKSRVLRSRSLTQDTTDSNNDETESSPSHSRGSSLYSIGSAKRTTLSNVVPFHPKFSLERIFVSLRQNNSVSYSTLTSEEMENMSMTPFVVRMGEKYSMKFFFHIAGKDMKNLRLFLITQQQNGDNTSVGELQMGNFPLSTESHCWTAEFVPENLGDFVRDMQFIDESGFCHLECSLKFSVVEKPTEIC